MAKKTTTTITIQGINVTSSDPAVMASAMQLVGALMSAALGPANPQPAAPPAPKRITAPKRVRTHDE